MPNPPRKRLIYLGRAAFFLLILFCLLFTFGLAADDEAAFRFFEQAAARWQHGPEFRSVAMDYTIRGSESMRTHLFLIPATRVIMALRSIPMLPKAFAVNPTSLPHYQDFSRGPLSAYLHLCAEQDVKDMAGVFAAAGRKTPPADADLRSVLDGYKMDLPVAGDTGALRSVAELLRDTDAGRGFTIRENIGPRLLDPIDHIARQLQVPTDPAQMTAGQQQAVLERLDSYVHASDLELWRTKQVSDFSIGVWAQVYGPEYKAAIGPILVSHDASKIVLFALLGFLIIRGVRQRAAAPVAGLWPEPQELAAKARRIEGNEERTEF